MPDGVELAGEGVMQLDPNGLPAGFAAGTETALVAGEQLQGNVVIWATARCSVVFASRAPRWTRAASDATAGGRVLVIASRRPADQLKATLRECEIVNHFLNPVPTNLA